VALRVEIRRIILILLTDRTGRTVSYAVHIIAVSESSNKGLSRTREGVPERDSTGVLTNESAPDLRAAAADGGSHGEEVGWG
jgi:hypothetical protein